jgi:hypothetical protein
MDAQAAEHGIPSLFLLDHENHWRLESDLTRDAYQRLELEKRNTRPERDVAYALFRDEESGFVARILTTSRALLEGHPRGAARFFENEAEADLAYEALGRPPLAKAPW